MCCTRLKSKLSADPPSFLFPSSSESGTLGAGGRPLARYKGLELRNRWPRTKHGLSPGARECPCGLVARHSIPTFPANNQPFGPAKLSCFFKFLSLLPPLISLQLNRKRNRYFPTIVSHHERSPANTPRWPQPTRQRQNGEGPL